MDIQIAELVGQAEWDVANSAGRPFVVYKFASTLDGRIAAADGTSQWITSPHSRAEVHLLRAGCHATIVGSGTQRADDPNLSVRSINDEPRRVEAALPPNRQPLRVIVDSNARTPANAKVLNEDAPTLIAVGDDANAQHLIEPATVLRIPRTQQGLDLDALLAALFARNVRAAFLEGGPTLAASFVGAGLVDRFIAYFAPALLGAGKTGVNDIGIGTMKDILRLELIRVDRSGPDIRVIARPHR